MKLTRLNDLIEDGQAKKGTWALTPTHEIQYRSKGPDEEIKLRGSLIGAEPDALVFSVTKKQTDQKIVASLLKLQGAWRLDSKNRIVFDVERGVGQKDTLTLKGTWKVGDSNEIIYTYDQIQLKKKLKVTREILFKGFWNILGASGLSYTLGADSDSVFRVRGAFQTKSIRAKSGEIRYQFGTEVSGKRRIQTITLFGKWKISRDLSLLFEIEYGKSKAKTISFGGEYALDDKHNIEVSLKTRAGEPLGVEVLFTKEMFGKDGQAFIRLQKSAEESLVEAGVRARW